MEHSPKQRIVFRKSKRLYLRPVDKTLHANSAVTWINDPDITRFLMRVYPMTLLQEEEWMDGIGKDPQNVVLAIHVIDDDEYIGNIGLHHIDLVNRNAETGTAIGVSKYQGKGYGTEAKMLLLDFAFNELGMQSVLSKVLAFNGRSLTYGKKCGYEEVGRLPNWIFRNGEWHDEVLLVVTQERWLPLWEEFKKNL